MASLVDDIDTIHPSKKMKHDNRQLARWICAAKNLMNMEEIPSYLGVANKEELQEKVNLWLSAAKQIDDGTYVHPFVDAPKKKELEENIWQKKKFDPDRIDGNYGVMLNLELVKQNLESGGDRFSLPRKVMKDAGCSESQIISGNTTCYFRAILTQEQAKKLSGLASVKKVVQY